MDEARLVQLGKELLTLKAQRDVIDAKEEEIKAEIQRSLRALGVALYEVQIDDLHKLVFKIHARFTKRFDKDGLASEKGVDRDNLDYHGISALVEKQILSSRDVAKYQSENTSYFVTVRAHKADQTKKKGK